MTFELNLAISLDNCPVWIYYVHAQIPETLVWGLLATDMKKACLKVGSVLICLCFVLVLILSLVGCAPSPTAVEKSRIYQTVITLSEMWFPQTTTVTFFGHTNITPVSGQPGTTITISFTGFMLVTVVQTWFDIDGDSALDVDEPSVLFDISYDPNSFTNYPGSVELIVPDVSAGDYHIYVDIPIDLAVEFEFDFHVTGFPLANLLWIICGVVLVIISVSILVIKKQLTKKKVKKTKEKFEKGEISLKLSNTKGKVRILSATPFRMDKAISIRLTRKSGKQSIKVEGPLLRDRKEGK
jgi:hypothetical protein